MMQIRLNGVQREVEQGTNIAMLLQELKLDSRFLAVERNRALVPRGEHARCLLIAGDEIEIVTLVGGG